MAVFPIVEPFAKATVSRLAVERERLDRLKIAGAVSAEITEDTDHWILTTNIRVADGASAPAPPRPAPSLSGALVSDAGTEPLFGLDSLSPTSLGKLATVTGRLGRLRPAFWGRYFYAPGQLASGGHRDPDHYASAESSLLRAHGIRVLPIARQTGNVGRDAAQAATDAERNVAAIFECFSPDYLAGADPDVLVFLDVEEAVGQPRLTADYYAAWSRRLEERGAEASDGRVSLRPAIYTSQGARETFLALARAIGAGAHCFGVWTARGLSQGEPMAFSDAQMLPVVGLSCPTLLCQFFLSADQAPPDENLDMSVVNPAHQDILLSRLVMPPG